MSERLDGAMTVAREHLKPATKQVSLHTPCDIGDGEVLSNTYVSEAE
jgi:hypothetical protein